MKLVFGAVALLATLEVLSAKAEGLSLYDIVPYSPGKEAQAAEDIRATYEKTGLDTFLYSVTLDPRGRPAFNNVVAAAASFRKIKVELKDAPEIKLGFLIQAILGHWERADKEIEPWQRSIDENGKPRRFCVLDLGFRKYIRDMAAALAAEGPCFVLTDDDVRAFSPSLECFCPLHTAEFNRRTGKALTPEEYRTASHKCGIGDEVGKTIQTLRDEIPLTVVKLVREGLDSVDPTIPAGCCMPGAEQLLAAERARTIAAKGQSSVLRFANGQYSELSRDGLVSIVLRTQSLLAYYAGKVDRLLDESDTCPHTLYARSGNSFMAKLALGIFNGLKGAKIWYLGMHKDTERVPEEYDERMGQYRKALEELSRVLEGSKPTGVRLLAAEVPVPLRSNRQPDFFGKISYLRLMLGTCGIPFYADFTREEGDIALICGRDAVSYLTDDEFAKVFRGKTYVDGPAAFRLLERKLDENLGCKPEVEKQAYNVEEVRKNHERPPIVKMSSVPALTNLAPGAVVCSDLRFSLTTSSDPVTDYVAPASVLYTNKLGGVTFTSSFDIDYSYTAQNLRRKRFFVDSLRMLDPAFEVVCENNGPNITLARKGVDGKTYAITVNTSYDTIRTLRYSTARSMASAEVLGGDGVWRPAKAELKDGIWTLPATLECMGFGVVRW